MDEWPGRLAINASVGDDTPVSGPVAGEGRTWLFREPFAPVPSYLEPKPKAELKDWRDPRVGWGLVLPNDNREPPGPIRSLLEARAKAMGAAPPVFRPLLDDSRKMWRLHNHLTRRDIPFDPGVPCGLPSVVGPNALPHYLLLYGTPDEIPWEVQYLLNTFRAVGRLDLGRGPGEDAEKDEGLKRYVKALIGDWAGLAANPRRAVVWSVDLGKGDITRFMYTLIAEKVHADLAGDSDIGANAVFLRGEDATAERLTAELARAPEAPPGLVVTTSHGRTGPLGDPTAMRAALGLPEDRNRRLVEPRALLKDWQPNGAVWYAHACCSAGSDKESSFLGLVEEGSTVHQVLRKVAELGSTVAPLPRALLGAERPLRAFVGHVEPTFDWTIRDPETGLTLTKDIREALYPELYRQQPVGLAFGAWHGRVGPLYTEYDSARQRYLRGKKTEAAMLYHLLAARDVRGTVILGDPTAALPPLKPKARDSSSG